MKKIATLTAAALVIGACGPANEDPAQKYRDAMPKSEAVQVGTPSATPAAGALTVRSSYVLGDSPATQSEYAIASRNLAVMINGGTAWTLFLLRFITTFPPTSCDDASCTWGPAVGDDGLNRWKLVVAHVVDHFDYVLSGQPGSNASAPWVDLITGTAYPGADRDHGRGTIRIDFDADKDLDHGPLWVDRDHGQANIAYDNTGTTVTVDATFVGAQNEKQETVNAAYAFERSASGGVLQVAFRNLTTSEQASLHTRWRPSGAGRGDAHYVGGVELFASECWDGETTNFLEVYDSKTPSGDPNACSPFMDASYSTLPVP